jgi:ABC-type antimicrobial peptide transport system permease subunit
MVTMTGMRMSLPADIPWMAIGIAFGLGLGGSMLAAYYPARLAGRLTIVRAVQYE